MAYKGMAQIDKKELWTIPNIITYFRILCIPAYILLMAFAGLNSDVMLLHIAFLVFIVAAGSDLVDGWIARKFNMTSGIGMALDPLADKLMHVSVLFCLSLCTGLTPLGQNTAAASGGWYVHYAKLPHRHSPSDTQNQQRRDGKSNFRKRQSHGQQRKPACGQESSRIRKRRSVRGKVIIVILSDKPKSVWSKSDCPIR